MSDALQLYFAITVNQEGFVTGMHACSNPMEQGFFAGSEEFSGDTVIPVDEMKTGILGLPLAALNEDYTPKPLEWRIENGYTLCPPGYELIDGELVKVDLPAEEQPPGIRQTLEQMNAAAEQEAKAARVMFRALAKTDVISERDALDNQQMFERWIDRVDTHVEAGEYLQYDDGLYRVQQAHIVLAIYPPSTATAALYTQINPPGEYPDWVAGSWDKDVKVRHSGKIWESMVPNNVWEPGAIGVGENIWKEVAA